MSSRSRASTGRRAASVVAVVVATAACSGASEGDDAAPVTPTGTTSAPAPSSTPTVSTPLSSFEDDPAVQALRSYYAGAARAVQQNDFTIPELVQYSTPERQAVEAELFAQDVGMEVPGPFPFTPVNVLEYPGRKDIQFCAAHSGWLKDPATGQVDGPWQVMPVQAVMVEAEGAWKVFGIYNEVQPSVDCSGVTVQGVPW